jgi:hypothetical protein
VTGGEATSAEQPSASEPATDTDKIQAISPRPTDAIPAPADKPQGKHHFNLNDFVHHPKPAGSETHEPAPEAANEVSKQGSEGESSASAAAQAAAAPQNQKKGLFERLHISKPYPFA